MNSKNITFLLLNPTFQFKAGKGHFLCLSISNFCDDGSTNLCVPCKIRVKKALGA